MQRGLFLLLVVLISNGCTGMLWDKTSWDCEPAPNSNLRVYEVRRQKDFLVVYNEKNERKKGVQERAYLVYKNINRIADVKQPSFVSLSMTNGLPTVPVFIARSDVVTNAQGTYYVINTPAMETFEIFSNSVSVGTFELPRYPDPFGKLMQATLSPGAIVVDTVIVAAAVVAVVAKAP